MNNDPASKAPVTVTLRFEDGTIRVGGDPEEYRGLPGVAVDALAAYGLTRLTPLVIGLALIAAYELVLYALKRAAAAPRTRRVLSRGRALTYPLALLVGYFGSPDTSLIARVDAVDLAPLRVGLLVVGLVVALTYGDLLFGILRALGAV
jgi:sec-independent protein translocase protein TatC